MKHKKREKYILFIFLFFSDFTPTYYRGFKILFGEGLRNRKYQTLIGKNQSIPQLSGISG